MAATWSGWARKDAHLDLQWTVENGELVNRKVGSDLVTEQAFSDFRLVCEYRYPEKSNSGIYLRGRYEVQILDDHGVAPHVGGSGAIYGFLAPSENAALPPDEWQRVEIELVGRTVTIVLNGRKVIDGQRSRDYGRRAGQ